MVDEMSGGKGSVGMRCGDECVRNGGAGETRGRVCRAGGVEDRGRLRPHSSIVGETNGGN